MIMEAKTVKMPVAFRLNNDLIDRLKKLAKMENRSLNNYVETILMDSVYKEPNEETLEAINEARSGKYAGTIDMKDFNTFMKSINEIE